MNEKISLRLIRNLNAKNYFLIIIATILLTDLTIFFDIIIFRQILTFLTITITPGLLIIHILKLNKIEFIKKLVLAVGVSIAFLIFVGFILNYLYLTIGFSTPLDVVSLAINFSTILTMLSFVAYERNKEDFDINDVFNFKLDLKDKLSSPLLFSLIFPFLAIFGTYLMNIQGNNIILLAMLVSIPVYVAAVAFLRDRIPDATYPIAIFTIALSLLLMVGLTSNYLIGRDVHKEYYAFSVVRNHLYWDMANYQYVLTATLSTSILPTIYAELLSINSLYVYKVVYNLIFSTVPLALYVLFKKYIGNTYAFLAAILFIAQQDYIYVSQSMMRMEIGLLFFVLIIVILFSEDLGNLNKHILLLIFMISLIITYYSLSYIYFLLASLVLLISQLLSTKFKIKTGLTANLPILCFVFIFAWYSQLTKTHFTNLIKFTESTFRSLANIFVEEAMHPSLEKILFMQPTLLPDAIFIIMHYIIFGLILVGAVSSILEKKYAFETDYILLIFICIVLAIASVVIPHIGWGFGLDRVYLSFLTILAPLFVIGCITISKAIKKEKIALFLITIVLIAQIMSSTYVIHQAFGVPRSVALNREGVWCGELYIYDSEIDGAYWLYQHKGEGLRIYTDAFGGSRFYLSYCREGIMSFTYNFIFVPKEIDDKDYEGYIYLRHANVVEGIINPKGYHDYQKKLSDYIYCFSEKDKIYDNSHAQVYKGII